MCSERRKIGLCGHVLIDWQVLIGNAVKVIFYEQELQQIEQ